MRFLVALALVAGCTQPRSARCKAICAREYECATATTTTANPIPFDEKECIAACTVLEGDSENLAKVQKHYDCVMKKQSCADVNECQ